MTLRLRARRPLRGTSTLRTRLTVLYGTAFAIAGTALVAILVVVASTSLENQPDDVVGLALDPDRPFDLVALTSFDVPLVRPGLETEQSAGSDDLAAALHPPHPAHDDGLDQSALVAELSGRVAAVNDQARAKTLQTIVVSSVAALLATLVVAVGVGWVMASRVLAPLHTVTATARRVAGDSLSARIALDGPQDEIKDLADTFDEMLDRLDASFDGQRRFTANASHELRTPLTITRSVLEVALTDPRCPAPTRELAEKLLEVNHRQGELIEGLLALASADLVPPEVAPVDLAALAAEVAADSRPGATAAGLSVVVTTSPSGRQGVGRPAPGHTLPHDCSSRPSDPARPRGTVPGDRVLLERLVRNLVDNAVRYNVADGWVHVHVPCRHVVVVENTGPVVPPEQVTGLFEPFRRLTPQGSVADRSARSVRHPGSGLGLSIVRSIAVAHEGTVDARPREDGGLVVRLWLPDGVDDSLCQLHRR